MDIITRRSFLGSLAFGSIYPNVEQFAALAIASGAGKGTPQHDTLVNR